VANRDFNELYDLILPYVPAVETPLVDYHIRRVTREFCRRTTLWRKRVTITTEAGVNDYLLSPYDATEGVIGGGGGGPPGDTWQPAGAAVSLGNVSGNGDETVSYNPTTSIWSLTSSGEYTDSTNSMSATLNIGTIGVGARVRLTPLPLYFFGDSSEWRELSYISGVYYTVTTQSTFSAFPGGTPVSYANTTGPDLDNLIRQYTPTPIVITNGVTADPVAVDAVQFNQGSANETPSTVAFNLLVEILPAPVAADPEICDPYSIISVTCDGRPIGALPEDARAPYGARPPAGTPTRWYSPSARVVHLYPTPNAVHTVEVDVVCALTMTNDNPVMPEFLFVDYREIIADGVIASLKVLGNKPWYDPEGASQYARRYANAVQGIRGKLRDANQPNISTARGPRFGR